MVRQRVHTDNPAEIVGLLRRLPAAFPEALIFLMDWRDYTVEALAEWALTSGKKIQRFIQYLDSVIAFPDKLKDKPRRIEKFLKKTQVDKASGEVVNTTMELSLDMDKIREYLDLMGYYTIMTSETDKSDEEIISKYHGLSRIEDAFRITKSNLCGSPVFVRTPEHINAHFLTCFIALNMSAGYYRASRTGLTDRAGRFYRRAHRFDIDNVGSAWYTIRALLTGRIGLRWRPT